MTDNRCRLNCAIDPFRVYNLRAINSFFTDAILMMSSFIRYGYTCILALLTPLIILRLYWKSRRLPAYRQRIAERFCLDNRTATSTDVWLHAVSLGEVVAATPLIDALLKKNHRIVVTTMTPTGSQHVLKRFGQTVLHQYVPYDLSWCLRRFFKNYHPRLVIIMETELWPNLIHQAYQQQVPLLLLNARLSDHAFKQYEKVHFLFAPVLQQFTAIFAQSHEDAKRFIALGAPPAQVLMLGNMKFDIQMQSMIKDEILWMKDQWGKNRTVVIAASTHEGEEKQWLSHLNQLKKAIPDVMLLLVPRHPERFQRVIQLSMDHGFNTAQRSQPEHINRDVDVLVVDSLGELLHFYSVSDYAFVGGSLVPIGGHNVLEPIAMGVPVFCGPHMNNSKAVCQALCDAQALIMVKTMPELIKALVVLHQNEQQRQAQIDKASAVLMANQGTIGRYLEKIDRFLEKI